jgi:hypothetical protein
MAGLPGPPLADRAADRPALLASPRDDTYLSSWASSKSPLLL